MIIEAPLASLRSSQMAALSSDAKREAAAPVTSKICTA